MPHERGPLPVLPSDFSINALADPKARFAARPPANPTVNRIRHPLDPKALEVRAMHAAGVLGLAPADKRCVPFR
jgi:hypothetical protein